MAKGGRLILPGWLLRRAIDSNQGSMRVMAFFRTGAPQWPVCGVQVVTVPAPGPDALPRGVPACDARQGRRPIEHGGAAPAHALQCPCNGPDGGGCPFVFDGGPGRARTASVGAQAPLLTGLQFQGTILMSSPRKGTPSQ